MGETELEHSLADTAKCGRLIRVEAHSLQKLVRTGEQDNQTSEGREEESGVGRGGRGEGVSSALAPLAAPCMVTRLCALNHAKAVDFFDILSALF
jgi:hypothetical protein